MKICDICKNNPAYEYDFAYIFTNSCKDHKSIIREGQTVIDLCDVCISLIKDCDLTKIISQGVNYPIYKERVHDFFGKTLPELQKLMDEASYLRLLNEAKKIL